jgi:hypothetical protein
MALAAMGAVALSVGVAEAGKGGGGGVIPPGTGTIYFTPDNGGFGIGLWSMNADGSGKTALPTSVRGVPSNQVHGGARWFLSGSYGQIHATREDGSSDVQFWNDTTYFIRQAVWGRDDAFVSFTWSDSPQDSANRISRLDIAFDADGVPSAVGGPVAVSGIAAYNLKAHTLSPSGDRVAWIDESPEAVRLNVTNVATGATTSIASTSVYWDSNLAWSPDGTRILFENGHGIDTIDPSGANRRNILQNSQSTSGSGPNLKITGVYLFATDWSPDSAAIVYRRYVRVWYAYSDPFDRDHHHYVPDDSDVYRASADGSATQNLTMELTNGSLAYPFAWR